MGDFCRMTRLAHDFSSARHLPCHVLMYVYIYVYINWQAPIGNTLVSICGHKEIHEGPKPYTVVGDLGNSKLERERDFKKMERN